MSVKKRMSVINRSTYTRREVTQYLGITQEGLSALIRERRITPIYAGKSMLFLAADVYRLKREFRIAEQLADIERRELTQLNMFTHQDAGEVHM
jgi:hypothetical protein